jgi:hypothetical protein
MPEISSKPDVPPGGGGTEWHFGGILAGSGTDPNTGPVLVLLAAAYWPRRAAVDGVRQK